MLIQILWRFFWGVLNDKSINVSLSSSKNFQILEGAWASFTLIVFPSISVWAFGASSLIQEVWWWADTFASVPDEWLLANTLVGGNIPVSWGWAFNTWWSISSSWADALSSVPDAGWWWAVTGVVLVVPDSWGWAWNTVWTEGVDWTVAGLWGGIPLGLWWWANTVGTDDLSWEFAAWALVGNVVPGVSGITNNASLVDGVPVFGGIALDTISTGNVVSLWAAWLLLIFTKSVVGNDLGKGGAEEKGDKGDFDNKICHNFD